jgi:hypothetical protein
MSSPDDAADQVLLCQVGKSGEADVSRSLKRRDLGLHRQGDQLIECSETL